VRLLCITLGMCVCACVCICIRLSVCLSVCVEEHPSHLHLRGRLQRLNLRTTHIHRYFHHLSKVSKRPSLTFKFTVQGHSDIYVVFCELNGPQGMNQRDDGCELGGTNQSTRSSGSRCKLSQHRSSCSSEILVHLYRLLY